MPPLSNDYVFMSYSRRDDAVMRRIVAFLREQRIKVWVDNEKLIPGTPVWEKEIEKAVQGASAVVVVLSPDSKDSEWVRREISLADQFRRRVFPVMVRGDEETSISLRLINRQFVDIRDNEGVGLHALETALSAYLQELKAQEQKAKLQAQKLAREKAKREATEQRMALEKNAAEQKAKEEAQLVVDQKVETASLEEESTTRTGILRREQMEQALRFKSEMDKVLQEKAELEERLKVSTAKENIETDNRLREAEEKASRLAAQKAELDSKEKLARENAERETAAKVAREKLEKPAVKSLPVVENKNVSKNNLRLFGIGGMILFVLICGGFSLNYIIKNLPVATVPSTATLQPTETPIPIPTLGIGSTMVSAKDGMTLLYVPAGDFLMGSTDADISAFSEEKPQHTVTLDAYWIDQTEVTNAMYAKCVFASTCKEPFFKTSNTHPSYYGNPDFDNYPVINVDWNIANTYCSWADRRLPTEAEWEKAARGTDGNIYPWGNTFDGTVVNICDVNCSESWADKSFNDGYADVSPVENYSSGQSLYGAYDMAGNVWEWVSDWYSDTYYQSSPLSNPMGPDTGQKRVMRGGSWWYEIDGARSAIRGRISSDFSSGDSGFRCARGTSP